MRRSSAPCAPRPPPAPTRRHRRLPPRVQLGTSNRGGVRHAGRMKQIIHSVIVIAALALVLAPAPARADGFITPWVGSAFGSNINNGQTTVGVSAGKMGGGIVGGEADFGCSPSY